MARTSWLDDAGENPALDAHVAQLQHFTDAMADGVVDTAELEAQHARVVAAMKAAEGSLDDAQHALVTTLLVELSAYDVMNVLHGLAGERLRQSFS